MSGCRRSALAPLTAVLLALAGCRELPPIPEGECGNRVLEAGEDCDGEAVDGVPCREPGAIGECRLDCSVGRDGSRHECPEGWACSAGTTCRPITGSFVPVGEPIGGNADSLTTGDFDRDGRDDVLSREPRLSLGASKLRIHYFSSDATLAATWRGEKLTASPAVLDVSSDGLDDIAYSAGNVHVLAGDRGRSPLPVAFPSYLLGSSKARVLGVFEGEFAESAALVVLARYEGDPGIFVSARSTLRRLALLPGGIEELAAEPLARNVFEDDESSPCLDLVFAYREAAELLVYALCERDPSDGSPRWRDEPARTRVALEPATSIAAGLVVADFDGDGHLDLLVGTLDGPYLARGDGTSLDDARPYAIRLGGEQFEAASLPLAAGDFDGDGRADLVFPEGVGFSAASTRVGDYPRLYARLGTPWTEAVIADLNGDELPDLAACSNRALDIDFFNGTGSGINAFTVPTTRPVEHLAVGDFDGDLVNDLAFAELRALSQSEEHVSIAFGRRAGAPEPPIAIAALARVDQLAPFHSEPFSTVAHLMISFEQSDGDHGLQTALAVMAGSGDRIPSSPIELTTFATDGLLRSALSVAVTAGRFTALDRVDLFALGVFENFATADYAFWLIPDVVARRAAPLHLGWDLEPATTPLSEPENGQVLTTALAASDLDRDGLDEVVLAAVHDGDRCLLRTSTVEGGETPVLRSGEPIVIDHSCASRLELALGDLDGDSAPEIVLVAGGPDQDAELFVFWNDGSGFFGETEPARPVLDGDEPRGFTLLPRAAGEGAAIAYVTESALRLLRPPANTREFSTPETLDFLADGTGVVAADVDGDGAADLAVADAGSVRILRAELAE